MNILSKLFGKTPKTNVEHTHAVANSIDSNGEITKDLFVDDQPPVSNEEKRVIESRLSLFLNRNFYSNGLTDGYEFHSFQPLETAKRRIRSEFRFVIEQMLDEKASQIANLIKEKTAVAGISDRMTKQLEDRIIEINIVVVKLENEKKLSIEEEGLVMVPINNYHDGFLRGVETYQAEKTFASSTGLFN